MKFRLCGEVCRITQNRQTVLNCDGNYKEKRSRPKRLRLLEVEGLLSQIEVREGCQGGWHLSWDLNTVEEESTWVWRNPWVWVWTACLAVEIVTRNALSTSLSQLCPHTKVSEWEMWRDWCHFTEGRVLPKFPRGEAYYASTLGHIGTWVQRLFIGIFLRKAKQDSSVAPHICHPNTQETEAQESEF